MTKIYTARPTVESDNPLTCISLNPFLQIIFSLFYNVLEKVNTVLLFYVFLIYLRFDNNCSLSTMYFYNTPQFKCPCCFKLSKKIKKIKFFKEFGFHTTIHERLLFPKIL